MKAVKIILVLLIGLALVVVVGKNMIAKTSVEKGVELATGLKLEIGKLDIGILKTLVGINDMKLFNPEGYADRTMIDMSEIYVDYDLPAIIKGKVHLEEVRIALKEFVVVKNKNGELNLDALKAVQEQKGGKKGGATKEKAELPEMQIDSLDLKIGKVIYKDYSKGSKPSVKEFPINLDEHYNNITDPNTLVSLIVVKALMNTTIAGLVDFDLGGLQDSLAGGLGSVSEMTTKSLGKAQEAISQGTEQAQKAVADVKDQTAELTEGMKDTAADLKESTADLAEKIKLPSFGK